MSVFLTPHRTKQNRKRTISISSLVFQFKLSSSLWGLVGYLFIIILRLKVVESIKIHDTDAVSADETENAPPSSKFFFFFPIENKIVVAKSVFSFAFSNSLKWIMDIGRQCEMPLFCFYWFVSDESERLTVESEKEELTDSMAVTFW